MGSLTQRSRGMIKWIRRTSHENLSRRIIYRLIQWKSCSIWLERRRVHLLRRRGFFIEYLRSRSMRQGTRYVHIRRNLTWIEFPRSNHARCIAIIISKMIDFGICFDSKLSWMLRISTSFLEYRLLRGSSLWKRRQVYSWLANTLFFLHHLVVVDFKMCDVFLNCVNSIFNQLLRFFLQKANFFLCFLLLFTVIFIKYFFTTSFPSLNSSRKSQIYHSFMYIKSLHFYNAKFNCPKSS